jgi:succinate dehydrogenase/fumarate reductase flavoprotein subunit
MLIKNSEQCEALQQHLNGRRGFNVSYFEKGSTLQITKRTISELKCKVEENITLKEDTHVQKKKQLHRLKIANFCKKSLKNSPERRKLDIQRLQQEPQRSKQKIQHLQETHQ